MHNTWSESLLLQPLNFDLKYFSCKHLAYIYVYHVVLVFIFFHYIYHRTSSRRYRIRTLLVIYRCFLGKSHLFVILLISFVVTDILSCFRLILRFQINKNQKYN